jgi:hypothetical protein
MSATSWKCKLCPGGDREFTAESEKSLKRVKKLHLKQAHRMTEEQYDAWKPGTPLDLTSFKVVKDSPIWFSRLGKKNGGGIIGYLVGHPEIPAYSCMYGILYAPKPIYFKLPGETQLRIIPVPDIDRAVIIKPKSIEI